MNTLTKEFIEILSDLLQIPSPPGCEERIAEIIRGKINTLGYEHETDPAGNVIVRIPGKEPNLPSTIFAAHMDEIAMVVTSITEDGNLKVTNSGGLIPAKLGECVVTILTDTDEEITGVFSMGSTHTKVAKEKKWSPEWENIQIITGLTPEFLEEKGVRIGSSVVPIKDGRGPHVFGDNVDPMIAAWTFDDRAGVAELLLVLKELKQLEFKPNAPIIFAFTVHEEGGCHGAKVLAMKEKPKIFIAVDGCPVIDPNILKLDGSPGTWSKDSFGNYTQHLVKDFIVAAKQAETKLQIAVYDTASSDASAVYNAGLAPQIGFIGHVRTNSHGYEVARLAVFSNTIKTILKYILDNS